MSNQNDGAKEMFCDFAQIGVVVEDLDRTIAALSEVFGIGPFRTTEWPPAVRSDFQRFYHDQRGDFTARMAFTELGPVELELIQPLEGASIWADYLNEHGEGIHHIRFNVSDVGPVIEYLAGHGIQASQLGSGLRPGTTWACLDTQNTVGFIIEIMNTLPGSDGRTPQIVNGEVQA